MAQAKRVLIYRLGSLGDTVVALPALHLVARAFPEAERRMLTNFPVQVKAPPAAAILEETGIVHGYIRYSAGTRRVGELARVWWEVARWRPEVVVYLGSARGVKSARRDARFFRMCGVRRLIGVPVTEEMQQNVWHAGRGPGPGEEEGWLEPEAARLARNIGELGDARLEDRASWDLRLTEAEEARAAEALRPLEGRPVIGVCVGTKVQSKDWERENWRGLLRWLASAYPEHGLAMLGAASEGEVSEFAAAGWKEVLAGQPGARAVVNLCGQLTPRESAAVLARAKIFLGHDSGPMHLAAAVQTPIVAIFAARNRPRVWFPYGEGHRVVYHRVECWGCELETCIVEQKKCIRSITVEEVVPAVRAVLGEG